MIPFLLSLDPQLSGLSPRSIVGAGFFFGQGWGIRVEWERFAGVGDDETTGESDVDLLSGSIQYHF